MIVAGPCAKAEPFVFSAGYASRLVCVREICAVSTAARKKCVEPRRAPKRPLPRSASQILRPPPTHRAVFADGLPSFGSLELALALHPATAGTDVNALSGKANAMVALGWSAPSHRIDAGTATRAVLWQHQEIRTLLHKAHEIAELALDDTPPSDDAVASAIGDVRATIEVHLAYEEKVLLPILRDDLPIGPERADRLLDEHRRQRETLGALHKEACSHPQLPLLAAKLAFLASWLLADMAEEEECLLIPEVIRDDSVVIDQSSG